MYAAKFGTHWTFYLEALSELEEFLRAPHARCKDLQKLVRNLKVNIR